MATCAVQNQARICVAGSLWGLCDEPVYPDGLLVQVNLNAPNGALLIDATGQCSTIALDEFGTRDLVADQDGCWRTCALVPNIGTVSGTFIEPGNTSYQIQVYHGTTNQLLYTSEPFVIDADQIGTYPVDLNGCVQLCVLSPPPTTNITNPFCDAVQACETPWIFTADPSGILDITPGDNPVGLSGNGHNPAFSINTANLCAFVQANCQTPFTGIDGFGIGFTAGGVQGHAPQVDFVPSTDPGQAIVAGGIDGQPYVGNASLVAGAAASGELIFTNNLGVSNTLDICALITAAACGGGGGAVSVFTNTITPGLGGVHSISHSDGDAPVVTTWDVVGAQANNSIAVGTGGQGGAFLRLLGGSNVEVFANAVPGTYTLNSPASSVVPNLASGTWVHNDNAIAGNSAVTIRSTSADLNQILGIGSDGGSYLELIGGTNVNIITNSPGSYTINATPGAGATSVFTNAVTAGLADGPGSHLLTHNDGNVTTVGPFPVVSEDAVVGAGLAVGSVGGAYFDLNAGAGMTLTPIATPGRYTMTAPPSSVVPTLASGIWTHNDNDPAGNNAVVIRSTSGDANQDLGIGADGGTFLDLIAGANITITGTPGAQTIAATIPALTCVTVSGLFTAAARRMVAADRVLVSDGATCERVQPTIRYTKDLTYDQYCGGVNEPTCIPVFVALRDGIITATGVAARTAPAGGAEPWEVLINGVAAAPASVSLAAGTTSNTTTGIAVAVSAGDEIRVRPVGPDPTTVSTCGTITIEITEALA